MELVETINGKTVFNIMVTKAQQTLQVVWDDLPQPIKLRLIAEGIGKLLNAATAKVTKSSTPDAESLKAQALGLAQKKLDSLHRGELRAKAVKGQGKASGVVMTEARRLAKNIIKAQIKAAGKKISDYETKAITEAANGYVTKHPELIKQAEESIAAAKALAEQASNIEADVAAIPVSASKVKAREEANAKKRAETLAKNAGKPGGQKSATAVRQVPKRAPASTGVGAAT